MKKYENWQDLRYNPSFIKVIRICRHCGQRQKIDPILLVACEKCYKVERIDKWITEVG